MRRSAHRVSPKSALLQHSSLHDLARMDLSDAFWRAEVYDTAVSALGPVIRQPPHPSPLPAAKISARTCRRSDFGQVRPGVDDRPQVDGDLHRGIAGQREWRGSTAGGKPSPREAPVKHRGVLLHQPAKKARRNLLLHRALRCAPWRTRTSNPLIKSLGIPPFYRDSRLTTDIDNS